MVVPERINAVIMVHSTKLRRILGRYALPELHFRMQFIVTGNALYHYEKLRRNSHADNLRMERLLVQSEKIAAFGTIISGLAHELNNPINFISFNIPILQDYLKEVVPFVDQHAQTKQYTGCRMEIPSAVK